MVVLPSARRHGKERIEHYTGGFPDHQPPGTSHLPAADRPQWRLPPGVPRGIWEYAQADQIAQNYDQRFHDDPLFQFDAQILETYFCQPGLVIDLGCGTGRALLPLARRGFRCLAVDLARPMLAVVGQKAARENLSIARIQANLVQLEGIRDAVADYALCLFSTLGMIRGRSNRQQALGHFGRILKPGGLLVLHVHNLWNGLFDAAGRRQLVRDVWQSKTDRQFELGDRFFDDRGVVKMFVHTFSQRELLQDLRQANLPLRKLIPLAIHRQRPLAWPWLLGSLRATGWIAVCQKPQPGFAR